LLSHPRLAVTVGSVNMSVISPHWQGIYPIPLLYLATVVVNAEHWQWEDEIFIYILYMADDTLVRTENVMLCDFSWEVKTPYALKTCIIILAKTLIDWYIYIIYDEDTSIEKIINGSM